MHMQYQWSCSPQPDAIGDRYHLPDLEYGDDEDVVKILRNLTLIESGTSYIYPIPSTLNCSGTVTAVEYCYRAVNSQLGREQLVFTLLTLQQSGLEFTITDVIPISSTPTSDICTLTSTYLESLFSPPQYIICCDTLSLNMMDRFLLSAENFAFGVIAVNLLTYCVGIYPQFLVDHFRYTQAEFSGPVIGDSITLTESNRGSDRALGLLQFFISMLYIASTITTMTLYTAPTPSTPPPTAPPTALKYKVATGRYNHAY